MRGRLHSPGILFLAVSLSIGLARNRVDPGQSLSLKTVEYKLDLVLDYEKEKLLAECWMTVVNPSPDPIRQVPLFLYRLMKVESVKDEQGKELPFAQRIREFEDWEKLQANFINVSLRNPLQSGEKKKIYIQYQGYLAGYTETGMLYVKDRIDPAFTIVRPDCLAYPQVGYPSWTKNRAAGLQSFDYSIKVTVPGDMLAANGGRLTGKFPFGHTASYVYRNIKPAWRIDIAVARYDVLEDTSNGLKVFYFPEDKEGAETILAAMKKTLRLYSGWFGPLQETADFSIIEIPEGYGSQADVTSVLQTRDAFVSRDQLPQLYHEISHFWDVPALDPLPSRFESEGLAMFLQYLTQEKLENITGATEKGAERALARLRKEFQSNSRRQDIAMGDYGKAGLTDLSYSKGMIFFYLLFRLSGEENFMDVRKDFYKKFRRSGATSADFISHLKESSTKDLTKFIQDWVYGVESSRLIMDEVPIEKMVRRYAER